jgi:hypothetical protein
MVFRMKPQVLPSLVEVLREARQYAALPDNDFSWSSWEDQEHALREMDEVIRQVETGDLTCLVNLQVLFAPTGPLQEVSLSSGWGGEFLIVAKKFDAVVEGLAATE